MSTNKRGGYRGGPSRGYPDQQYVGNQPSSRGGNRGGRGGHNGYEEEKRVRVVHDTSAAQQTTAAKEEVIYDQTSYRRAGRAPAYEQEEQQYQEYKPSHQVIRGTGRGHKASYYNDGQQHYGYQQQHQDPNEFQPTYNQQSGRGRGRGRGYQAQYQEFQPTSSGQGRGKPQYDQYNNSYSGGNNQYYTQQQPAPFAPYLMSGQQWVGDYTNNNNYQAAPTYQPSQEDTQQQPPDEHPLSGNFRPGPPGVIHYAKQPKTREQRAVHSNSQKSQITATQDQFLKQYDHRLSFDDNEERVIQDERSMSVYLAYKEYQKPEFFQAPTFVIFKEQSKIKNHRYPEDKIEEGDDDKIYQVVQFPPLKPPRGGDFTKQQQRGKPEQAAKPRKEPPPSDVFDIKTEKRKGNKFWREIEEAASKKRPAVITTTTQATKGGRQGKKERLQEKKEARKGGKGKGKVEFEEYLSVKEEINKGIAQGKLFEGLLRVNPNNRNRAFVSIEGIPVDVMIDGLSSQNRALDGDTVIIQLLNPARWPSLTTQNIIVGGKKWEKKGITNETAVETRVIDVERGLSNQEEHHQAQEAVVIKTVTHRNELKTTNILGESEEDQLEQAGEEDDSSEDSEEDKFMDKEEDKKDIDQEERFVDDHLVDSDTESEEEFTEDKPRNPFKREKEPKEHHKPPQRQQTSFIMDEGKSRAEVISIINDYAKECRPLGRVKAIIKSPNREREQMVTLTVLDKDCLESSDTFLKMLVATETANGKKGGNINQKIAMNSGIYAVPVSKKLPWMSLQNIPPEFIEDLQNDRKPQNRYYIAKFESWNVGFIRPLCKITQQIGEAGNLEAESLRILKTHEVWSDEYETAGQKLNEKVHESLRVFAKNIDDKNGEWKIPEEEVKLRRDLRHKRIFTIDPLTAKDLDDALSIEHVGGDIYELGVHIADVSYFVQQGTELDKEAQLRCTSVYFVHRVYPMLPRLLCERLCSLNPQVDRLSYSIFFRMNIQTGEVIKEFEPVLTRSVMRSCAKWNYQLVQDILDKKITLVDQLEEQYRPKEHKFEDMVNDCFLMHQIAQKRRAKRLENGSIMLSNREFMFKLDQETMLPQAFTESKTRMPSKHLVEEYMLMANILVAEHLHKYCNDKTILRVHPDLDKEKKEKLQEFFERAGLKGLIDLTNSKTVSYSLEALRASGDSGKFNVAMRKFLTCLQCAKYMCINETAPEDYQHFGLNFPLYTHFTSPIRRYADLLVHRLVTLTLTHKEKTRDLIELMDYSDYAEQCSEKSLNAKRASTQCTRLFHCLLLKQQGVRVFETLLFDLEGSGVISIYIDEVNMHHKIRLRDDPRVNSVIFFEEELVLVAHIKTATAEKKGDTGARVDAFTQVTKLEQLKQFAPEEVLIFRIFDKIKVKVDTTTEFPLDIKCTLMFAKEDLIEYARLAKEQEAAASGNMAEGSLNGRDKILGGVVEIENLDADV